MICFGWVGLYGISNMVSYLKLNLIYTYILNIYDLVWIGFLAYLIPNPVYTYISKHMICEHILLITFLNKPKPFFLFTVKFN